MRDGVKRNGQGKEEESEMKHRGSKGERRKERNEG